MRDQGEFLSKNVGTTADLGIKLLSSFLSPILGSEGNSGLLGGLLTPVLSPVLSSILTPTVGTLNVGLSHLVKGLRSSIGGGPALATFDVTPYVDAFNSFMSNAGDPTPQPRSSSRGQNVGASQGQSQSQSNNFRLNNAGQQQDQFQAQSADDEGQVAEVQASEEAPATLSAEGEEEGEEEEEEEEDEEAVDALNLGERGHGERVRNRGNL